MWRNDNQHPHQIGRQRELAATQNPHAIVLSCADSRVALVRPLVSPQPLSGNSGAAF